MTFEQFNLPQPVIKAVRELGYNAPTDIQVHSIPLIMQGKDVIGQSSTGSGKTAAFSLPIIGKITPRGGLQMLVLTPTRELCNQVKESIESFSRHLQLRVGAVYGGVGMGPQIEACRYAEIIVACPGRLLDIMSQGRCNLRNVKYLVLDEADRMLDMGFIHDVEKIIREVPRERQTLLFSATMEPALRQLVNKYMKAPEFVQATVAVDTRLLHEVYYAVRKEDKFSLLAHCLKHETPGIALVFCRTRRNVDKVTKALTKSGIESMAIHGGLSQNKRDRALDAFSSKDTAVLVATDIAGRGLHIEDISHVYNYDIPHVADDYVHRIGRTARAGKEGDAVSFVTMEDFSDFKNVMRHTRREIQKLELPQFEKLQPIQTSGAPTGHHGMHRGYGHGGGQRPGRWHSRSDERTGDGNERPSHGGGQSAGRPRSGGHGGGSGGGFRRGGRFSRPRR